MDFNREAGEKAAGLYGEGVMPWGKFKGVLLSEIPAGYLGYLLDNNGKLRRDTKEQVEREVLRRVIISMREVAQQPGETIDQANARHEREAGDDALGMREVAVQYAYMLLKGDPEALDILEDILTRRG